MAEQRLVGRRLTWRLSAAGLDYQVHCYTRVTSTQDLALRASAAGAPERSLFLADVQEAGRGRQGRSWLAPSGTSVMFSVVWRPPRLDWARSSLSLAAGLAVAEGIEMSGGPRTELKWPNDCLIQGRKVAGILIEAGTGSASKSAPVVVGVGCNVAWRGLAASDRPASHATALDLEGSSLGREDVAFCLIASLDRRYRQWCAGGLGSMVEEWWRRSVWVGEQVQVRVGGRLLQGRLLGVDGEGRLRLGADGVETMISVGDLEPGEGGSVRLLPL
ncbi:MAG: biotin--[acetyl-CoA-carboxylase] ligase [Candidatus Dormibacteria bacterium]